MKPTPTGLVSIHAQSGVALVLGLLLLTVMCMIGVSLLTTTNLETMMAGGARESNIAFQAAEAALRDAEARIEATTSLTASFPGDTTADNAPIGQVGENAAEPDFLDDRTWIATARGGDPVMSIEYLSGSVEDYPEMPADGQPRFILKHVADVDFADVGQHITQDDEGEGVDAYRSIFRATARGTSRDGSAVTILQSYYGKKFD